MRSASGAQPVPGVWPAAGTHSAPGEQPAPAVQPASGVPWVPEVQPAPGAHPAPGTAPPEPHPAAVLPASGGQLVPGAPAASAVPQAPGAPAAPAPPAGAGPVRAAEPGQAADGRPGAGAAGPGGVPALGVPFHSGTKPPLYPPEPQGALPVRPDPLAALIPDMVVDGAVHGPLTVRAASVRGDSHRYHGEPRQDALAVTRVGAPGDELLLLAVADGVGSASRSHVGSHEACRLAATSLDAAAGEIAAALREGGTDRFTTAAGKAVVRIATLLSHQAQERGDDPAAYATTLRVLLVPLDPAVRLRGFLAVGDGGTSLLRAGQWAVSVTGADQADGGMIDTRTPALPHGVRLQAELLGPAEPGDLLVLSTDGLSTPLAGDAGMREFLARAWGGETVPGPADFLWQLQYRVKSYDDDRTAVALWEGRS
ncbi:protein phosphatase 2C domain-containing protein [Streptomyces actuosus]|uniref:Protein phosphatase 2C domain-containing protein n=2 Tax=Streptomyces actuosus TaxID=1885 RepID=A0ABS2VSB1_STRAS|nr:protein phosphatase 2C domain-containing protein [Streptomyces actuosus]